MADSEVFSASQMLALPEENGARSWALSAAIYGVLCDMSPLYIVFIAGNVLVIMPTLYMCAHKNTKEFILDNG